MVWMRAWLARYPWLARWLLAGLLPLIATFAIMGGMAIWWPRGAAGVDQIAMPIILFPLIWVAVFVYAVMDDNLLRIGIVLAGLILGNGVLIAMG